MIRVLLMIMALVVSTGAFAQQDMKLPFRVWLNMAVGKNNTTIAHPSAYVDVGPEAGATKGVLPARGAIGNVSSPALGLEMFNISDKSKYFWDGTKWVKRLSTNDTAWLRTVISADTTSSHYADSLFAHMLQWADSLFGTIKLPQKKTFPIAQNTSSIFDSAFIDAQILSIDRNSFFESNYSLNNGLLSFPDGLYAGERLDIVYSGLTSWSGGGVDSGFVFPYIFYSTGSSTITLPTTPAFVLTVDLFGQALKNTDWTVTGDQVTINFPIEPNYEFRIIYW